MMIMRYGEEGRERVQELELLEHRVVQQDL